VRVSEAFLHVTYAQQQERCRGQVLEVHRREVELQVGLERQEVVLLRESEQRAVVEHHHRAADRCHGLGTEARIDLGHVVRAHTAANLLVGLEDGDAGIGGLQHGR